MASPPYTRDPRFAEQRGRLLRARRRRRLRGFGAGLGAAAALCLTLAGATWLVLPPAERASPPVATADGEAAPAFSVGDVDARRAPLLLPRTDAGGVSPNRFELRFRRTNDAIDTGGRVFYVADRMMGDTLHMGSVLPASPQDFAMMTLAAEGSALPPAGTGNGSDGAVAEVGSTTLAVLSPDERAEGHRDVVVKALTARAVSDTLVEAGAAPDAAAEASAAVARALNQTRLPVGAVAAARFASHGDRDEPRLAQLSIYDRTGRIGSLARAADGTWLPLKADPWAGRDLADVSATPGTGRLRVMDGLYAAGTRNGVPPEVVTETLIHMARHHDLSQFIEASDTFRLLYSEAPRAGRGRGGHVLYASVRRGDEEMVCYVLKPATTGDHACMNENDLTAEPLGPAGFVTPVAGVLSSGFGPRAHPILGTVRMHSGVDWAAPTGTPVRAAFDGRVREARVRGGYGNYVRLDHGQARQTAYAHLSRFASGIRPGRSVRAGEVIGYVGTTGQSTGPHLHFELIENGRAVDPLTAEVERPDGADSATSQLVQRIIIVESGGRANAKNPLSSATGLGQFIDSTWIRMMRSYRPDLVRAMSRRDLLDLRFDPGIAREMTRNLALENGAELRRAGNRVTAGNLYLAHFLGSAGANQVLRTHPDVPLIDVVGGGVIRANPFLRGRRTGWVVDWAARKMRGRRAGPAPRERRRLAEPLRIRNSRLRAYSAAIDRLLERIETAQAQGA